MPHKIFVLLWKDLMYRKHRLLFLFLELLPIIIVIIMNSQAGTVEICYDCGGTRQWSNNFSIKTKYKGFEQNQFVPEPNTYRVNRDGRNLAIFYEPDNAFLANLMKDISLQSPDVKTIPGSLENYEKIDDFYKVYKVKFHGLESNQSEIPKSLHYTIYPGYYIQGDDVFKFAHLFWRRLKKYSRSIRYDFEYFEMQTLIDSTFVQKKNITIQNDEIQFITNFRTRIPKTTVNFVIFLLLFFMYAVSSILIPIGIVEEKISGAKELLLIMGLKRRQIWLAKFIDSFIPSLINITIVTLFLYLPGLTAGKVFSFILPTHFILFFLLGTTSIICFLFFLGCFLNSVLGIILVTALIYPVVYLVRELVFESSEKAVNAALCLIPHCCLEEAIYILHEYEVYQRNVNYLEIMSLSPGRLTLLEIILMMMLDMLLYSALALYLEQIWPGKFGVPQPIYFFLLKRYWIPNKVSGEIRSSKFQKQTAEERERRFEEIPTNLEVGISIEEVSKIYKWVGRDTVRAVDDVTISFYKGELTGLLGNNGAGKTTLISIICGMIPATSGRVLLNNYDVGTNTEQARKTLGFCPQQNMLFSSLSAIENIVFFGMIKGLSKREAYKEAKEILKKFRILHVKNTRAGKLSGGQKRKVSLAIALSGNSEVIILDEPTSGLDPEIRREVWDLLLLLRGSKTIILTTHFMDEADALCDRIAIMDSGRINIFGTPMFLKSNFGTGYTLSVVVPNQGKINEITELVTKSIKGSTFKSRNALTICYLLPEIEVRNFPSLFKALDEKRQSSKIVTYSVNNSSLEDVFLRVSSDQSKGADEEEYRSEGKPVRKHAACTICCYQIWALLIKKFTHFKNNIWSYLVLNIFIILIAAITILSMSGKLQLLSQGTMGKISSVPLSFNIYKGSEIMFKSTEPNGIANIFKRKVEDCGVKIIHVEDIMESIEDMFQKDFHRYSRVLMGVEFSNNDISIVHNYYAVHIISLILNNFYNAYLEYGGSGDITTNLNLKIFAKKRKEMKESGELYEWDDDENTFLSTCPLSFLALWPTIIAFFYLFEPLEEKNSGVKHLQLMATPTIVYYLAQLIVDFVTFVIPVVIICLIYGLSSEAASRILIENWTILIPALTLWMIDLILFYYAITTICSTIRASFFVFALLLSVAVAMVHSGQGDKNRRLVSYYHPTGIMEDYLQAKCGTHEDEEPTVLILSIHGIIVIFYLLLRESKILGHLRCNGSCCCRVKYDLEYQKDTLVEEEENNVRNLISMKKLSTKELVVADLKRWFCNTCKKSPAVKGITFSVNHGECFGLLGTNGAGKTSVFNMLTGVLVPSTGRAYVDKVPLFNHCKRGGALFKIGFCPQSGGFISSFKVKEMLALFARLRGIPSSLVNQEVEKWIKKTNLQGYGKRKCGNLSGGNQRKLVLALAFIGDSPLILLDEPTTGVDPGAKRLIWNQISRLIEGGQSVVLTSHSMDECEALCTRLTIMVKGQLCCLGETVILKEKFGGGYSVLFKISAGVQEEDKKKFKDEMVNIFDPGCNLTDEHATILQYHMINSLISWKDLFAKLSEVKKKFKFLESYSASAATLEQLFIYFARKQ